MADAVNEMDKPILVVDDDEQVRPVIAAMLLSEGFAVIEAATAREALDILEDKSRTIGLLLTDIAMPERLNGFGLAHRARQARPDLPIVYASGYFDGAPWRELGIGYGPMLQKPFKSGELIATIRETLSAAACPGS